jgi:transcriptional regulator with XRE-family HTH domain
LYKMRSNMPALAPPTGATAAAMLVAIGQHIRAHRKRLSVSATDAAQAAGISRVTLHRIERGEPSVAMGSYLNVVVALGLDMGVTDAAAQRREGLRADDATPLPANIRLADYPQLKRLAWQREGVTQLSHREALGLYERNWRHVDLNTMEPRERALITALARQSAGGRLLV